MPAHDVHSQTHTIKSHMPNAGEVRPVEFAQHARVQSHVPPDALRRLLDKLVQQNTEALPGPGVKVGAAVKKTCVWSLGWVAKGRAETVRSEVQAGAWGTLHAYARYLELLSLRSSVRSVRCVWSLGRLCFVSPPCGAHRWSVSRRQARTDCWATWSHRCRPGGGGPTARCVVCGQGCCCCCCCCWEGAPGVNRFQSAVMR
jgi:hypothetical protein